jgi:hypothetical protein
VGKRPLRRPRHRWEDDGEMGWVYLDWINLTQDRVQWN